MGNLGELGVPKVKHETAFVWFGVPIRVHPKLTDLLLMDFAEEAQKLDENSPEVMSFLKRQIRILIAPEDFDAFWQGALDNGQESVDLLAVMKTIVEEHSKRPTLLPSDSSAGQGRTVVTSPDVSSLPATAAYQPQPDPGWVRQSDSPLSAMDRRVIESMPGRPDLALIVDEAARQRAAG